MSLSQFNDYFFGALETTIVFYGAYRLLNRRYIKIITISMMAFFVIIMNIFIDFTRNSPTAVRSIGINFIALICFIILFEDKIGKTLFFTFLLYYEMMVVDVILGNLLAFLYGADIVTLLHSNQLVRFGYSLICKLLLFMLIIITIQYFKKIDLNIQSKYWFTINSILLLFFAILILFLTVNPMLQTKETSIVYFFVGICYFLVNFMVVRLFGDLCFFFQNEKLLSISNITNDALQKQLSLQEIAIKNVATLKHDIKNNMLNLTYLINEKRWDEVSGYIDEFGNMLGQTGSVIYCKNNFINAILNLKKSWAEQNALRFDASVDDNCTFNLTPTELTSILSNLIDNAIEAALFVDAKSAFVEVKIYIYKKYNAIRVSNSYINEPKCINGTYITTKENKSFHGIGLKSVKQTVKKHDGFLEISTLDNTFTVIALLKNQ